MTTTDAHEVNLIISSLNSLPTKILKLLKNDIYHVADMFDLSFSLGVFPSILKIAEVIPVHKKELKQFCSNYRPISLLSNMHVVFLLTFRRLVILWIIALC